MDYKVGDIVWLKAKVAYTTDKSVVVYLDEGKGWFLYEVRREDVALDGETCTKIEGAN